MNFTDRTDAGKRLAGALDAYAGRTAVVYALPRGGVPVAVEVARALDAPLDLIIPRKIGHPQSPEYAIAAVTERGQPVENRAEVARVDPSWYREAVDAERAEADRRRRAYLGDRKPVSPKGKVAILVDDGIATGLTMRAAVADVRDRRPQEVVVAAPVASADAAQALAKEADAVVTCGEPEQFLGAIGTYYERFEQLTDDQVSRLLKDGAS